MEDSQAATGTRRRPESGRDRMRKYRQAAVGYLIYGLIYLAGAVYLSTREQAPQEGLIWFGLGALMVIVIPVVIWKEFKWITRILALLVAVRVFGLLRVISTGEHDSVEVPWGGEISIQTGAIAFLIIAAAECYLLIRAGWDLGDGRDRS